MSQTPSLPPLGELLGLLRQARNAQSEEELRFLLVNSTHSLVPYRQAALVEGDQVSCLSGTVSVERNAPYVEWLARLVKSRKGTTSAMRFDATSLPQNLAADWAAWLPSDAAWIPMGDGGLLVARDIPFSDSELSLLADWSAGWKHALEAMQAGRASQGWQRWFGLNASTHATSARPWWRRKRWWALALLLTVSSIPVPLTVLAPAEIVPHDPETVCAPLDAVVERVHVKPNQRIRKGDVLLSFDERMLRGRIGVAAQALTSAEAEYQQTSQRALFDVQVRAQLPMLAGRVEERRAELALAHSQLSRTRVVAQREGVVMIDDPASWSGKPVVVGERILRIADPKDIEIEAWIGVHDLTHFQEGSLLSVYLNADPLHPVAARLRYLAYEASERPDGSYAYRMRARLEPGQSLPRVGAKGTARIESRRVTIAFWLLRKPWAAARAWVGW